MSEELILHQKINLPYRYTAGTVTETFLEGLTERTIRGTRCAACGHFSVPARPFCPVCSEHTSSTEDVEPLGHLESWTETPHESGSRVFALIRIADADNVALHLVDADPNTLEEGMALEPQWTPDPEAEITAIRAWRPIRET